jgi:hypothetical protein
MSAGRSDEELGSDRCAAPHSGVPEPLGPPSIMQAKSDASRGIIPMISNNGLVLPKTEATARRPIAPSSHRRVQSARGLNAAIGGPPHAMIGVEAAFQRKTDCLLTTPQPDDSPKFMLCQSRGRVILHADRK